MNIQAGDNYLHKFDRFYTGVWTFYVEFYLGEW